MSILKFRKWLSKKLKTIMAVVAFAFTVGCFSTFGLLRDPGTTPAEIKPQDREIYQYVAKIGYKNEHIPNFIKPVYYFFNPKAKMTNLTREEFHRHLSQTITFYRSFSPEMAKGINHERIKSETLDNMTDRTILLHAAAIEKVKVTKAELEEKINEVKNNLRIDTDEQFKRYLNDIGYANIDAFKEMLRKDLLITNLQQKIRTGVKVTEEEIIKEYEEVKARHILVKDKKKADEIYNKLKHDKTLFEQLAKEHSEDTPTKDNGGDLGYFKRGRMVKEFEEVAFALKEGEISPPVKTQFGYHIIKVEKIKKATGKDYKKEKQNIKQRLTEQKKQEKYDEWFKEFKTKKVKVTILDPQIIAYRKKSEGELKEAIKYYQEAVRLFEYDPYIRYSLAKAYEEYADRLAKEDKIKKEYNNKALKEYKKATDRTHDADIHFALAELYHRKLNNKELAYKNYKEAHQFAGDDLSLRYRLRSAFEELNKPEDVEKEMVMIAQIHKKQEEERKRIEEARLQQQQEQQEQQEEIRIGREEKLEKEVKAPSSKRESKK